MKMIGIVAAIILCGCIKGFRFNQADSQNRFAAKGETTTLLILPVKLPMFAKTESGIDTSKGFACAYSVPNSAISNISDAELAKLQSTVNLPADLEVLTTRAVSAADALFTIYNQNTLSRIAQTTGQDASTLAAAGATTAGGIGAAGLVVNEALDSDDILRRAPSAGGANINITTRSALDDFISGYLVANAASDAFDLLDNRRRRFAGIEFDEEVFSRASDRANAIGNTARSKANSRLLVNSVEESNQAMKEEIETVQRLKLNAQDPAKFDAFLAEYEELRKRLEIDNMPLNRSARSASDRILEMNAATIALEEMMLEQHHLIKAGQAANGLRPASDKVWDRFVFALNDMKKTGSGQVKLAIGAAALTAVVVGGTFAVSKAFSMPKLEGLLKLGEVEIERAKRQLAELSQKRPAHNAFLCANWKN